MSKTMRDILYEIINDYPKVEINKNTSLQGLENLGEGTFIIDKFPSIELIKQFPLIFDCGGEVGLNYIEGVLILTLSKKEYIEMPTDFYSYVSNGRSQFAFHSHPAGPHSRYPSIGDIEFHMYNDKFYIITDRGLIEVDVTQFDKGKNIKTELEKFMNNSTTAYEDSESLYYYFYKSLNIEYKRYTEDEEIKDLINKRISKKIDFWDKIVGTTSYPGKKK